MSFVDIADENESSEASTETDTEGSKMEDAKGDPISNTKSSAGGVETQRIGYDDIQSLISNLGHQTLDGGRSMEKQEGVDGEDGATPISEIQDNRKRSEFKFLLSISINDLCTLWDFCTEPIAKEAFWKKEKQTKVQRIWDNVGRGMILPVEDPLIMSDEALVAGNEILCRWDDMRPDGETMILLDSLSVDGEALAEGKDPEKLKDMHRRFCHVFEANDILLIE
jgi:hypothetical protein